MSTDLPQIVAIFVNVFHKTEGYKIVFAKSNDIKLDGCEYKTLPSGIDKITSDVVYFTHGERSQYIGIAAYRNLQSPGDVRGELSCVSIAVMVLSESQNLRHQRLNRIWLYCTALHDLCARFDPQSSTFFDEVEAVYERNRNVKSVLDKSRGKSPPASPVLSRFSSFKDYSSFQAERQDTQANSKALLPHHELSNLHPVLSLHDLISFFGPLIFPLHRAALCRQRILIVTDAPVQRACHFIYNIQLLAAIPNHATTYTRPLPLRQLFCLSVNDIPQLDALCENSSEQGGWIGTTTDRVLISKTHLYDYLVELPRHAIDQDLSRIGSRPIITLSNGERIKPSYLDGRNFLKLKSQLPLYRHSHLKMRPQVSWKRSTLDAVLSGFFYWASAGQFVTPVSDVDVEDGALNDEEARLIEPSGTSGPSQGSDEVKTLIMFQRLTTSMLTFIDERACESLDTIVVNREQMSVLGLTPRLASDVKFIELFSMRWFSRKVVVDTSFCLCC